MQAVAVKLNSSDAEALDAKVFKMRDSFTFGGSHLNIVMVDHPEAFTKPTVVVMDVAMS